MKKNYTFFITLLTVLFLSCDKDDNTDNTTTTETTTSNFDVNPEHFIKEGLSEDISKVECTLSDGTKTMCYKIVSKSEATEHDMGPWCPTHITDDKSKGGIWFEKGEVYDVDGEFIKKLATFYSNSKWKMYDDEGKIHYTATREACEAAARPNVDPMYQNHCVECLPSYLNKLQLTYLIPVTPVKSSATSQFRPGLVIGVALNGVNFDPPAPTQAILGAYTLAPMDDCGGHVNMSTGYHYHAMTGCNKKIEQSDTHSAMIGYALDGFKIFELLDKNGKEPENLDECRGHTDDTRGYHYHVNKAGANQLINCFKGAYGSFTIN